MAAEFEIFPRQGQPDPVLDRVARLAFRIFHVPISIACVRNEMGEITQCATYTEDSRGAPAAIARLLDEPAVRAGDRLVVPSIGSWSPYADAGIATVLCMPFRTSDGAVTGTIVLADTEPRSWTTQDLVILEDVAATLRSELEIARPEVPATDHSLVRAVLDAQRDAIYVKDLEGRYLLCNSQVSEITGVPGQEMIGKEDWALFPTDLACSMREWDQQVISRGEPQAFEFALVTPTATRKYEDWKTPYRDAAGRIAGVVGITRDVTVLRAQEAELKLRERQLADAERLASLGSWECDGDAGVVLWSEQMYEIFGLDASAPAMHSHESYLEHVHPADRDRTRDIIEAALSTGKSFEFEHRISRSDQEEETVVLCRGAVTRNENGSTRVVGTCQDITASRKAEKAIRTAMAEAERANEAKSSFLSRMSHELRTPLNAILGFGQVMQADPTIEDRESVEQILGAGMHLLGLVDEMLDLAKIEAGKMEISPEPASFTEVGRICFDLIRPMAEAAEVTLVAGEGLSEERYVIADSRRLKQIMLNLLSNAIKYNRKGGSVVLDCMVPDSDRLRLTVRDSGPGLDPQQVAGLFNPFERMGAERSRIQGTGLGLAVSRGLAEAMGGVLGVDSTPGEGSTFWIELPEADITSPAIPMASVEVAEAPLAPPLRGRVVYIEDNPANLRLVERIIGRRTDLEMLSATTGAAGLELVRTARPDLVLLDVQLPDIDGDEVLWKLQQDPDLRQIPVVAISGDATPAQIKRLLDLGARDYVTKPFQVEKLLETIDRMLSAEG